MSRKDDLEKNIHDCYTLIRKHEAIKRDTDRPEERERAERIIDEEWELIGDYLDEYLPLCKRLGTTVPDNLRQFAARFGSVPIEQGVEVTLPELQPEYPRIPATPRPQASLLPVKGYRELIGRDALVGDIMAALRDPAGKWIVAVDGMGGIGKTALALEVADRCLDERLFDVIVWEQAPREEFMRVEQPKAAGSLNFETVLDAIARQLGALDGIPQSTDERRSEEQIFQFLSHRQFSVQRHPPLRRPIPRKPTALASEGWVSSYTASSRSRC